MGLIEDISPGRVAVDTAIFIYLIEESPRFLPVLLPLFEAADQGRCEMVTSAITLLEVLVVPYRTGNEELADRYTALLTRSRGLRLVDLSRDELSRAARLRAQHNLRTPDALQLAAAQGSACSAFLTNDRRLPALPNLPIIQLGAYVG